MASNCSASSIKPFNKSSLERGRGSPSIDSESAFEKPIATQVERQRLPHLSSGIMVSQEITVDIQEATIKEDLNTGSSNLGHSTIGPRRKSQPGTGNDEPHIGAGNHSSGSNKDDIAGASTGMSNVEIGTENEARTFVDELLVLCIE